MPMASAKRMTSGKAIWHQCCSYGALEALGSISMLPVSTRQYASAACASGLRPDALESQNISTRRYASTACATALGGTTSTACAQRSTRKYRKVTRYSTHRLDMQHSIAQGSSALRAYAKQMSAAFGIGHKRPKGRSRDSDAAHNHMTTSEFSHRGHEHNK